MESLRSTNSYTFGLGPQGYCYMPNRTFAFQPHNLFFQFLAEWGVIGTLLFFSLLSYGFIKGVKSHVFTITKELNIPALAAGAIIISLGAHSLVDGIFYHAQSSFYIALAFAVWIAPQKKKQMNICKHIAKKEIKLFLFTIFIFSISSYWGIRSPDNEIVFRTTQALSNHHFFINKQLKWKGFV